MCVFRSWRQFMAIMSIFFWHSYKMKNRYCIFQEIVNNLNNQSTFGSAALERVDVLLLLLQMLFIASQTCQASTSPSPICRALPTPGSGMLFGLLLVAMTYVWTPWSATGISGMLCAPRTPLVVSWCFCTSSSMNPRHSAEVYLTGEPSSYTPPTTRTRTHTHTIFIPSSVKEAVLCSRSHGVGWGIYWFLCVCLTLWRMFGIGGSDKHLFLVVLGFCILSY